MNKYLFIACCALLTISIISLRTCQAEKNALQVSSFNAKHANDSVKYWIDKSGIEHAQALEMEGKYDELANSYAGDMDAAAGRLQIKDRQIDGLQNAIANVKGGFSVKVIHDTTAETFYYRDSSMQETATITDDTAHVSYDVTVPVHLTQYWHRTWLFGKKTHYVDGYSENPDVHITNLQSVRILKEPGRWGLGPYIGVSLNGPSLGIALTYSLIRF